jgi:hypothetical protein
MLIDEIENEEQSSEEEETAAGGLFNSSNKFSNAKKSTVPQIDTEKVL